MTTPVHVHETFTIRRDARFVADRLRGAPQALSEAATAEALHAGTDLMLAGGFRARALPTVEAHPPRGEELGSLVTHWVGDEDATGWPEITLWALVLPNTDGTSTLALISPRHPGIDLSTNRVDKVWRDRLARTAVRSFGNAMRRQLEADVRPEAEPDGPRVPALAGVGRSQEVRR